jgi:DNA modification methylase
VTYLSSQLIVGDCRRVLSTLPNASVDCCVTSPPYFGLRDYGHEGQIGLEQTPDEYVQQMVAVFREVRRVLRDDGTLWLNLGDSYAAQRSGTQMPAETLADGHNGKLVDGRGNRGRSNNDNDRMDGNTGNQNQSRLAHRNAAAIGLKHKDLIGIPWRVAFALQADGWYLRQDIIWHKPNPMPESVTDRCTKAHEYIFLLSKSPRYHYDAEAIAEPAICAGTVVKASNPDTAKNNAKGKYGATAAGFSQHDTIVGESRNRRSVWTVNTKPYRDAHFATYPPDLILPCVLAGCRSGGTVLDPFNGAGTTGLVSLSNGRQYVGIELNPEYAEISMRRFGLLATLVNFRKHEDCHRKGEI